MDGAAILTAADWAPGGHPSATPWWLWVSRAASWALAAWLVYRLVRAFLHRDRYRAEGVFGPAEVERVREAIREAERRTVGEILPVVVERSDDHPQADFLASVLFLLVGTALFEPVLPFDHPLLLVLCQLALGAAGLGLVRLAPDLKRSFVSEDRATEMAEEQAFQEFFRNGLHKTEAQTGVLLFVSLFERRVIVLGDEGIAAKVDAGFWQGVDEAVLDGVARGDLAGGLVAGIERVGAVLAEHFPWREGDRNEIPDRVIVRRK